MRSRYNLKRMLPHLFRKSQIPNPKATCSECGWGKGTHWMYCDQCLADMADMFSSEPSYLTTGERVPK